MANKSSVEETKSRYSVGGETTSYANRLGWWERKIIPEDDTDLLITLDRTYAYRPDLVAADYYNNSTLMWLVLQFNNIVDINEEFTEGKEIRLPHPARVTFEILKRK